MFSSHDPMHIGVCHTSSIDRRAETPPAPALKVPAPAVPRQTLAEIQRAADRDGLTSAALTLSVEAIAATATPTALDALAALFRNLADGFEARAALARHKAREASLGRERARRARAKASDAVAAIAARVAGGEDTRTATLAVVAETGIERATLESRYRTMTGVRRRVERATRDRLIARLDAAGIATDEIAGRVGISPARVRAIAGAARAARAALGDNRDARRD